MATTVEPDIDGFYVTTATATTITLWYVTDTDRILVGEVVLD